MKFLSKTFNAVKATAKPVAIGAGGCAVVAGVGTAVLLSPFLAIPAALAGAVGGGYLAYKNNKPG